MRAHLVTVHHNSFKFHLNYFIRSFIVHFIKILFNHIVYINFKFGPFLKFLIHP